MYLRLFLCWVLQLVSPWNLFNRTLQTKHIRNTWYEWSLMTICMWMAVSTIIFPKSWSTFICSLSHFSTHFICIYWNVPVWFWFECLNVLFAHLLFLYFTLIIPNSVHINSHKWKEELNCFVLPLFCFESFWNCSFCLYLFLINSLFRNDLPVCFYISLIFRTHTHSKHEFNI